MPKEKFDEIMLDTMRRRIDKLRQVFHSGKINGVEFMRITNVVWNNTNPKDRKKVFGYE